MYENLVRELGDLLLFMSSLYCVFTKFLAVDSCRDVAQRNFNSCFSLPCVSPAIYYLGKIPYVETQPFLSRKKQPRGTNVLSCLFSSWGGHEELHLGVQEDRYCLKLFQATAASPQGRKPDFAPEGVALGLISDRRSHLVLSTYITGHLGLKEQTSSVALLIRVQ